MQNALNCSSDLVVAHHQELLAEPARPRARVVRTTIAARVCFEERKEPNMDVSPTRVTRGLIPGTRKRYPSRETSAYP